MFQILPPEALAWMMFVLIVLAAVLFLLTTFSPEPKAPGTGARHRRPGLARVTPSGTYPRRRADAGHDYAEALGTAGGAR